MPTTRPRVPGWHPDPEDPGSIRHWNGKKWGDERRPRPSWAPELRSGGLMAGRASGGPGAGSGTPAEPKLGRRQWYLLAAIAVALAVFMITAPAWLGGGPAIPPQSVHDTAFLAKADAVCAKTLPALRDSRPLSRDDNGTPAAFAARIEKAAVGLEKVDVQLRALPVKAGVDAAEVDRWLGDWESYTAVGHRYAAAIRAQDQTRWDALSAEGQALAKRIFVFSKANDMASCVF